MGFFSDMNIDQTTQRRNGTSQQHSALSVEIKDEVDTLKVLRDF